MTSGRPLTRASPSCITLTRPTRAPAACKVLQSFPEEGGPARHNSGIDQSKRPANPQEGSAGHKLGPPHTRRVDGSNPSASTNLRSPASVSELRLTSHTNLQFTDRLAAVGASTLQGCDGSMAALLATATKIRHVDRSFVDIHRHEHATFGHGLCLFSVALRVTFIGIA